MRVPLIFALLVFIAGNAWAVGHQPVRRHPYRRHWKESLTSKQAILGTVVFAGIGQARGDSRKYGGGVAGFGKHVGLGYATHAVGSTVEHLVAAPLHEDLDYHPSNRKGFGPRLKYALVSTVVARNTHTGKHQVAAGRLSGSAASGAFAATVLPAASGASTAGFGLAAVAGTNVAREFWPRKKKVHAQTRPKHSGSSRA
jgi:hypothetical protein